MTSFDPTFMNKPTIIDPSYTPTVCEKVFAKWAEENPDVKNFTDEQKAATFLVFEQGWHLGIRTLMMEMGVNRPTTDNDTEISNPSPIIGTL